VSIGSSSPSSSSSIYPIHWEGDEDEEGERDSEIGRHGFFNRLLSEWRMPSFLVTKLRAW
jgi:hypothetical protein